MNPDRESAFRIDRVDDGPVTIVRFIIHRLISTDDVQEIGEALEAIVERDQRDRLVLDLGQVDFPSSAFLGRVLWIHIKLKARHGRLALCNLGDSLERVFHAGEVAHPDCLGIFRTSEEATIWAAAT